jgi:hypothetical protein
MSIKLSHSALQTYTECNLKWKLHYKDRLRSSVVGSALLYGGALDSALNILLKTKNLSKSQAEFDRRWRIQEINGEMTDLSTSLNIKYSKKDLDEELLTDEELLSFQNESTDTTNMKSWLCLRRKGHLALKAYHKKVMPLITKVLCIQKPFKLDNGEGDEINGYIDAIVEIDEKKYLIDNKSSSIEYEKDSAGKSQQLITYYHSEKEEYKLNGVGFIVMYKAIEKNRKKICSICQFNGSSTKHEKCNNLVDKKRCNGEWIITIDPECLIDVILNEVESDIEDKIINDFDQAVIDIKQERFEPNKNACISKFGKCQYFNYCHKDSLEGLITLPKREEKT